MIVLPWYVAGDMPQDQWAIGASCDASGEGAGGDVMMMEAPLLTGADCPPSSCEEVRVGVWGCAGEKRSEMFVRAIAFSLESGSALCAPASPHCATQAQLWACHGKSNFGCS